MTRYDRIFGDSKLASMLRADQTIADGMAELGRALEREIKRQDRAAKRGKPVVRAPRKRGKAHG